MQRAEADLLAAASRMAAKAGRAPPTGLVQLAGGRNNRVFRAEMEQGTPLVLKSYFSDPRDTRDRLAAEWGFLAYAWAMGVRCVPEPIGAEPAMHVALYGYVPGRKLNPGEITTAHLDAAAAFIASINPAGRGVAALPPASESCFSLDQHLATVERRVQRLAGLDRSTPLWQEVERFVASELLPAWTRVRARIGAEATRLGVDPAAELPLAATCTSPSDFGFHNALVDEAGNVAFLDFEYAGRDDPAKLVCDFFCQPEVPVGAQHFERFLRRIGNALALSAADCDRCRLLLDAYRIKWACIILNEFVAVGAARRAFAYEGAPDRRRAGQLDKARAKLSELSVC